MIGKIRMWVVRSLFNYLFNGYNYPFIESDDEIAALNDAAQRSYFTDASGVLHSRSFKQEINDSVKHYYRELAMKSVNRDLQFLNMGAAMALEGLHNRFKHLSNIKEQGDNEPEDL